MAAPKKRVPKALPAYADPKSGMNSFSNRGVKKPVRAAYYGKKAR